MTDFKALTPRECAEKILKTERPLVVMHARPDGDTVGSGAALMVLFRMLGKEPKYICADTIPERLAFLLEGEKSAENDDLSVYEPVAVDIASPAQMGDVFEKIPAPCLMIDHHEVGKPFADNYIIGGMSSAAEVVTVIVEELISMGKIKMTKELAYPLYAGISSDTASFRYSATTAKTHLRAAYLIEQGIDFSEISHRLFSTKSRAQLAAEGYAAENMKVAIGGKVAFAAVSLEQRNKIGAEFSDFETSIDIIRSLAGVEIAFIVKESDRGEFRVSIRSTGRDVALIASFFGGGGHIRAAGCNVSAVNADEAANIVLQKITEVYFG